MGLALATTAAVCVWLTLYSVGVKAFDASLLMLLIILIAAVVRMITPHVPGTRKRG